MTFVDVVLILSIGVDGARADQRSRQFVLLGQQQSRRRRSKPKRRIAFAFFTG
ncbi:MAG: hypothetical protein JWN14_3946, partial [Chthonomonadales bacterium]|nr:hypothetical protein [Chthonomonadales bacterium]